MKWFSIQNLDEAAEVLIYEQIGKDIFDSRGIEAKAFVESLNEIPRGKQINVRINSPGGSVWDGLAIYNALDRRRQAVTVHIDGIAASIASVIAMAGGRVVMPQNALLMMHDANGLAMGSAAEMRKLADALDKHSDIIADVYARKSGKPREHYRKMMAKESWFTGTEAKHEGLADVVTDGVAIAANFDMLSRFHNVPEVLNTARSQAAVAYYPDYYRRRAELGL